jgi:hypothetical protein
MLPAYATAQELSAPDRNAFGVYAGGLIGKATYPHVDLGMGYGCSLGFTGRAGSVDAFILFQHGTLTDVPHWRDETEADYVTLGLVYDWHVMPHWPVKPYLQVGVLWVSAEVSAEYDEGWFYEGFGLLGGVGLEYRISRYLSCYLEGSVRTVEFSEDFEFEEVETASLSGTSSAIQLGLRVILPLQ